MGNEFGGEPPMRGSRMIAVPCRRPSFTVSLCESKEGDHWAMATFSRFRRRRYAPRVDRFIAKSAEMVLPPTSELYIIILFIYTNLLFVNIVRMLGGNLFRHLWLSTLHLISAFKKPMVIGAET
jgi:hypothetical protein